MAILSELSLPWQSIVMPRIAKLPINPLAKEIKVPTTTHSYAWVAVTFAIR